MQINKDRCRRQRTATEKGLDLASKAPAAAAAVAAAVAEV